MNITIFLFIDQTIEVTFKVNELLSLKFHPLLIFIYT